MSSAAIMIDALRFRNTDDIGKNMYFLQIKI